MSKRVRKKFPAILMAMAFLFGPVIVWACSVPVFRYALELWPPDNYEVVLFFNGPLNAEQKQLLEKIRPLETENASVPNIQIHEVDLKAKPHPRWLEWWEKHKPADTSKPWMAVFYPQAVKITPLWAGTFSEESVKKAFHSPARQTVAKRLQAGDSAVWVLLECGSKEKDQAARKLLDQRLKHLGETLEMPDLKPQDVQAGYLSIRPEDLKLGFSVITVAVDDPAEAVFREILLNSEDDLKDYDGEPITFPVFGRGRALPALVGKGINNDMIDEASTFLSGPCSCQVKRQNPGFDLLTSVNWDQLLEKQINDLDDKAQVEVTTETEPSRTPENSTPSQTPKSATPNPTPANPTPTSAAGTESPQANPTTATPAEVSPPSRSLLAWIPLAGIPILLAGGLILLLGRRRDS